MHKSTILRIIEIRKIAEREYEPERLDKCYAAVWRYHIVPTYGIDYTTFMRYIRMNPYELDLSKSDETEDEKQLKLFE